MCFFVESDAPAIYAERSVKSVRKPRPCCDCGRTIAAGESCLDISGKWEGEFRFFTTCDRCCALREAVVKVELAAGCGIDEAQPAIGDLRSISRSEWKHYAAEFERLGLTDAWAIVPLEG